MPRIGDTEKRRARAQAVDEEFQKLEKFQVDRRRIIFIDSDHEASGGYGIVLQAELHQSAYLPSWLASRQYGPPQLVAVKQIKIAAVGRTPDLKRAFTKEMLVWSGLEAHPGIAKFIGFYADFKRSEAWLISPWEPNGNVSEFIHDHNPEVPEKLSLVHDTIDALSFLHQLNPPVCHGDIKSANVLVSAKFRAILCDFGLARLHEDSGFGRLETSTGFKGSIRWCSPEVINGEPRKPTSDIYSWAWLVWEIMTGTLPYEGTSADYAIMRQIFESPLPQVNGESRLSDCLQIWELMTRCWDLDPPQRPTANMCKTTVTYLPRCIPTLDNADHPTRGPELLENLGDLETWKGNITESFKYLNEALRLYEEDGNAKGIASVLTKQAAAWDHASDYLKLEATASTALAHCRNLNDDLGIADASFWLGHSFQMRGKWDTALPILRESLEIYRAYGNDVGATRCLERIGEIHRMTFKDGEALATMDEAMTIASRSGDRLGVAKALLQIGVTHFGQYDLVKATNTLSEASAIAEKIGWKLGVANALGFMGSIKMREGEYPRAEELLQECVSIARSNGLRWQLAQGLSQLGPCFRQQGKLHEAARALEEACALFQDVLQFNRFMDFAPGLAELRSSQGEWDSALFWYDRIIVVCRSLNRQWEVGHYLIRKGDILVGATRYDEAALHFEAAITVQMEGQDDRYWIRGKLCAIPKTAMKWERRFSLLCDVKRLQRRLPQLVTANLRLSISPSPGQLDIPPFRLRNPDDTNILP